MSPNERSAGRCAATDPVRVGVLGVGDISEVYLRTIAASEVVELVAVASRNAGRAMAVADRFGARPTDVAGLLGDGDVELVLNLTPAQVHDELNLGIVSAGKHLYSEKPFSLDPVIFSQISEIANENGLKVGSAPDTFFGAAHQTARRLVDDGAIGRPVYGSVTLGHPGIELFHPRPEAFYQPGGEAPSDIGPYYLVQWINLLGPVRRVFCAASTGVFERLAQLGTPDERAIPVAVPTSYSIVLQFEACHVQLLFSLDVPVPIGPEPLLTGTAGMLRLPDPNFFGDDPVLITRGGADCPCEIDAFPFGAPTGSDYSGRKRADYRGVGLVELALCIRFGGEPRTGGALLDHVTELLAAIRTSWKESRSVEIVSSCPRPSPIGTSKHDGDLVW